MKSEFLDKNKTNVYVTINSVGILNALNSAKKSSLWNNSDANQIQSHMQFKYFYYFITHVYLEVLE